MLGTLQAPEACTVCGTSRRTCDGLEVWNSAYESMRGDRFYARLSSKIWPTNTRLGQTCLIVLSFSALTRLVIATDIMYSRHPAHEHNPGVLGHVRSQAGPRTTGYGTGSTTWKTRNPPLSVQSYHESSVGRGDGRAHRDQCGGAILDWVGVAALPGRPHLGTRTRGKNSYTNMYSHRPGVRYPRRC